MKPTESIFCPIILVYQFDAEKNKLFKYIFRVFIARNEIQTTRIDFEQHITISGSFTSHSQWFPLKIYCENK